MRLTRKELQKLPKFLAFSTRKLLYKKVPLLNGPWRPIKQKRYSLFIHNHVYINLVKQSLEAGWTELARVAHVLVAGLNVLLQVAFTLGLKVALVAHEPKYDRQKQTGRAELPHNPPTIGSTWILRVRSAGGDIGKRFAAFLLFCPQPSHSTWIPVFSPLVMGEAFYLNPSFSVCWWWARLATWIPCVQYAGDGRG